MRLDHGAQDEVGQVHLDVAESEDLGVGKLHLQEREDGDGKSRGQDEPMGGLQGGVHEVDEEQCPQEPQSQRRGCEGGQDVRCQAAKVGTDAQDPFREPIDRHPRDERDQQRGSA